MFNFTEVTSTHNRILLESYSLYPTCLSYAEKVVQRRFVLALGREAFLVQTDSNCVRMDLIWVRNDSGVKSNHNGILYKLRGEISYAKTLTYREKRYLSMLKNPILVDGNQWLMINNSVFTRLGNASQEFDNVRMRFKLFHQFKFRQQILSL